MPVTVQLPGFKSHEAPISALAGVANAAGSIYGHYKQGQVADAQVANENLKTQQAQVAADQQAKMTEAGNDPTSPLYQTVTKANSTGLAQLASITKDHQTQTGLAQLKNLIDNGVPTQAPDGQTQNRPLTLQEQDVVMKSPLVEGMKPVIAKMQADASASKLMGIVDTKNNSLADSIAEHFKNDKVIMKYEQQRSQLGTDIHTLQSGAEITPAIKAELEKGLANALSGGGSSGLGQTDKVEYHNIFTDAAKLKGYWTGSQQQADPPGYRQYLIDTFQRLDKAAELNQWGQAQRIAQQKSGIYRNNPQAGMALKQSAESYRPAWVGQQAGGEGQAASGGGGAGPGGAMSFEEFMKTKKGS